MSDRMARSGGGGTGKAVRRYAPIAVVVVIIGAIALVGALRGGNDKNDKGNVAAGNTTSSTSNLPLTFDEAKDQGKTIDFGPKCDPETGRVAIPLSGAPQCVEPWSSSKDNGGATYQGVTKDAVKIVVYVGQNDPLQAALVKSAGASTDPSAYYKTDVGYLEGFAKYFELYGRKLDIIRLNATGGPDDHSAAIADAVKITKEIKPFAVVSGPGQAPEFFRQIAKAKILAIGGGSTIASEKEIAASAPYLWPTAISPEQFDDLLAEMVGKQLAGKNAEFAGDPKMQKEKRVFGWIQAQTEQGQYKARNQRLFDELKSKYDVDVKATTTYTYDPAQAQNIARTVINKMKAAGVTTIMVSADPLIPANYTAEATAQNYFPEWIVAPSVYMDTSIFGRTYDQKQWAHAIGVTYLPVRAPREESEIYKLYQWFTGGPPPINSEGVPYARDSVLMTGLHLAGPNLTPETFREGLFRYKSVESTPTRPHVSWSKKIWGRDDYNTTDDVSIIWWDPKAQGEDETGKVGDGLYRYVENGKRFLPGTLPTEPIKFFDPANTVTVLDHYPTADAPPSYPPPGK
jgi:hypothetical protein